MFAASPLVGPDPSGAGADVLLADTADKAQDPGCPVVLLAAAPALGVPALDPRVYNPIGWRRMVERRAVVLGSRDRLPAPPGRCVRADASERAALLDGHHLADVAAWHPSTAARAGTLVRVAATGLPVHLADGGPGLAPLLGAELHALMTCAAVPTANEALRESLSVRMRRIALRDHSLGARARQVCAAALDDPPRPPKVSVLLATRRPAMLARALASVARQNYPELELVLALHGEGFDGDALERGLAGMRGAVRVVRVGAARPLGAVLNAATAAASGLLLTKMDDDDAYGADHVWDLVLAHAYSGAALVGKPIETVYLGAAGRTVRRTVEPVESFVDVLAGGALLIARHDLARVGGWRRVPGGVDRALIEDVRRAGGVVYRTHGRGFMLVRHGVGHTWEVDERSLRRGSRESAPGWRPGMADIEPAPGLEGPVWTLRGCAENGKCKGSLNGPAPIRWTEAGAGPGGGLPGPAVSVVMPVGDEDPAAVAEALAAIRAQDHDGKIEVVVADAFAAPGVRAVAERWGTRTRPRWPRRWRRYGPGP